MAKLAHKIGGDNGKRIRVLVSGDDLLLKRKVVNAILNPLIQFFQNAVDHGLEAYADASSLVSNIDIGTITLSAHQCEFYDYVEVRNDGLGIDSQHVVATAVEQGLLSCADELSDGPVF